MEIEKNINVKIAVWDGHSDCCGVCNFYDPDNNCRILFRENFLDKRVSGMTLSLRLEECLEKFGIPASKDSTPI